MLKLSLLKDNNVSLLDILQQVRFQRGYFKRKIDDISSL